MLSLDKTRRSLKIWQKKVQKKKGNSDDESFCEASGGRAARQHQLRFFPSTASADQSPPINLCRKKNASACRRQDGEPTWEISLSPGYRKRRLIRPTCRSEPPQIEAAFDSAADRASDRLDSHLEETWTTRSVRDFGYDLWFMKYLWFILKVMHRKLFFTSCLACCWWWSKLISSLAVSSVSQREEKTGRTDSSPLSNTGFSSCLTLYSCYTPLAPDPHSSSFTPYLSVVFNLRRHTLPL